MSNLSSPWWLLLALIVAALAGVYVYIQRLRARRALRFANLEVLNRVAPVKRNPLRHVPIALLVVALLLLTVALSGPQADRKVPRNKATVILVMDVSRSMNATDVAPSRIKAAQASAKKFADELTEGINLGLVSYAGTASTLVSPTPDHTATKTAADKLQLADKTATGEGIFAAIQQIQTLNTVLGGDKAAPPARIVLLSDGKETVPDNPNNPRGAFTAARKAKEEKIPVSTISFGTMGGTVDLEGDQVPVPVDDASLRQIANISGGEFFTAASLDELNRVYEKLQKDIGYETRRGDNSRPWLIAGTLLAILAAFAALVINRRLP
ncbi:VWA domain-containing protein [Gordonia amarae]|uniref:VWFA domain-containing protein n=2 Tax=Gordonia amarae TaxID=36821 RepID=G7GJB5_9ACTN|nr:VWA domain-containing protein [Gordonia amarae]MCS3879137.1 Ca-activated chloride channel family protein [Gordonia amarae]QHN17662.1 VWA domain-containing protein [Gordonia amarae]QHN22192.1 VWA domain-containing protein [Gordonia amarae]QHN31069.1 VWA domain-containing protein [Gordonia amarae]QHN39814.1 VWA domain-containing protein [Gordonia amarae]